MYDYHLKSSLQFPPSSFLQNHDAVIIHLESRPSRTPTDEDNEIDYFIQFSILSSDFNPDTFVTTLQKFVVTASLVRYMNMYIIK